MGISLSTPQIIKSIQRGTITLASVSSNTATITAVDIAKSVLIHMGWSSDTDSAKQAVYLSLTNSTTVTANRGEAGATGTSTVSYEVVEFY